MPSEYSEYLAERMERLRDHADYIPLAQQPEVFRRIAHAEASRAGLSRDTVAPRQPAAQPR